MIEFSGNEHEREKVTVGNKCHKEKLGLTPTYYVKTGFLYTCIHLACFFIVLLKSLQNKGFDHRHHQVDKSPNKQIIGRYNAFCLVFVQFYMSFLIQRNLK